MGKRKTLLQVGWRPANGRAALTATQSVAGGCLLHKRVPGAETTGAKRQRNGRVV